MADITTTIDGIHGIIKILVTELQDERDRILELKWCVFDNDGLTGFLMTINNAPAKAVIVTELAAEQLIRMIVADLATRLQVGGNVKILNHMGESLPDVQFLPPTFDGNEADIILFVSQQNDLSKLYAMYQEDQHLSSELIHIAEGDGILEDFLSLIEVKTSGMFLSS